MADNLIFQTEKQIKEFNDKLTEEDKSALNQDLESLKTAHSTKDVQAIDTASEKLNSTWGTISTRLYQETQSEPQVNTDTDTGNGGDVEDTSYEEVK
jgi:molecular chaperone DnaK